jgi:hypothetical protein
MVKSYFADSHWFHRIGNFYDDIVASRQIPDQNFVCVECRIGGTNLLGAELFSGCSRMLRNLITGSGISEFLAHPPGASQRSAKKPTIQ